MTNTIKILIARENSHKKMEASNYYLEFSTIEELEDKLYHIVKRLRVF